jgi:hypothetical protein
MERFPDPSSRLDLSVGSSVEVRVSGERTMERLADHSPRPDLAPGTSVEVRGHFRGEWSRGFEVAETTHDGYWVRRLSDRYLLPVEFLDHDVRRLS